jgi:hypothetical protein
MPGPLPSAPGALTDAPGALSVVSRLTAERARTAVKDARSTDAPLLFAVRAKVVGILTCR